MGIFRRIDDAFADTTNDAHKLEEALGKARVNRQLTLPAAVIFFVAFFAMAFTRTPRAEIFGAIAVVNFALLLKSDSDVKLLSVLKRLQSGKAGGDKKPKPSDAKK